MDTIIVGLRSFSKMSAADFAMTIATGSRFGAMMVFEATDDGSVVQGSGSERLAAIV